jgi:hypothetical protein
MKFLIDLRTFLPNRTSVYDHARAFVLIFLGALILYPIVRRLPMFGWDWYYFFLGNNPSYNLMSPASAYPPFVKYIIHLIAWMDWRDSLGLLNSISIVTIAVATFRNRGYYGSVLLAIITPPVWFLLWIGHPDALALLGVVTGFIPLALIKPQLTIWSMFASRKLFFWMIVFVTLTLVVWPLWPLEMRTATLTHEAAFGWVVTGWPVAMLGFILFLGAGKDPYRLISSGMLMSPYLMPYNLAILAPAIGSAKGYKKILLYFCAWSVVIGTGLGGKARILNLIYPVAAYCLNISWVEYKENVIGLKNGLLGMATRWLQRPLA